MWHCSIDLASELALLQNLWVSCRLELWSSVLQSFFLAQQLLFFTRLIFDFFPNNGNDMPVADVDFFHLQSCSMDWMLSHFVFNFVFSIISLCLRWSTKTSIRFFFSFQTKFIVCSTNNLKDKCIIRLFACSQNLDSQKNTHGRVCADSSFSVLLLLLLRSLLQCLCLNAFCLIAISEPFLPSINAA